MVTFANWLTKNNISNQAMADRLKVSRAYVSMLRRHKSKPSIELIKRMVVESEGQLTTAGLINEFY